MHSGGALRCRCVAACCCCCSCLLDASCRFVSLSVGVGGVFFCVWCWIACRACWATEGKGEWFEESATSCSGPVLFLKMSEPLVQVITLRGVFFCKQKNGDEGWL